jgi:aldehyde:ferredoxin oxidoreductase
MNSANGSLLSIDVSAKTTREEGIDDELASFIGGRGVATRLAHERIPFDADPFGSENAVYFSTGPLQMSQMSFTGRMNMTGLSPLTDGLLSTNAGGYLSRNFVDTGHAVVEITGESDDLVGLHVTDDGVTVEAVPHLREATVPDVMSHVTAEHGLESEHVAAIGPAGENRVRFASVMTYDHRAFGRGGLGAVLGSKNVKFLTFQGESPPQVSLPDDVQSTIHREAATADDMMKRQGTTAGTEFINDDFSLPTRYFSEQSFEDVEDIGGDAVEAKKTNKAACSVCAFACKLPTKDEETGLETEGPEFETIFLFGGNAGVGDLVSIMRSNERCDTLGMDTISAGNVVSAYLAANDEFGNTDLVDELVRKIAYREGIGDTLAEGVDRCHEALGVENWSIKGLELAAHDGRVLYGQALSYATANRGGDHMYSATMLSNEYGGDLDAETLDGKPEFLITDENRAAVRDSAVLCDFGGGYVSEDAHGQLLDASYDELLAVGGRIVELERHFNNKRGMDRADDRLPYEIPGFEDALDEYYDRRGWTRDGTVPDERVAEYAVVG